MNFAKSCPKHKLFIKMERWRYKVNAHGRVVEWLLRSTWIVTWTSPMRLNGPRLSACFKYQGPCILEKLCKASTISSPVW